MARKVSPDPTQVPEARPSAEPSGNQPSRTVASPAQPRPSLKPRVDHRNLDAITDRSGVRLPEEPHEDP
jgi:hypothetical protein